MRLVKVIGARTPHPIAIYKDGKLFVLAYTDPQTGQEVAWDDWAFTDREDEQHTYAIVKGLCEEALVLLKQGVCPS